MSIKKAEFKSEGHLHNWYPNPDGVSEYCSNGYNGGKCMTIKIGLREWERRKEEYDAYLELSKTTDAYRDYQEMKQAYAAGDQERMAEIDKRVMARNQLAPNKFNDPSLMPIDPMPKPSFPDPEKPFAYLVEAT